MMTISVIGAIGWIAYFKKSHECNEVECSIMDYIKGKIV